MTQQTYGQIRAADEIIDEGHFIGKALGEALNGYRPIVELMVRCCCFWPFSCKDFDMVVILTAALS
jgi:pyruvate/2-oxoglutarate/acetoin dehydrogenase E1 component